jgi:hypothetical protein
MGSDERDRLIEGDPIAMADELLRLRKAFAGMSALYEMTKAENERLRDELGEN